MAQWLFRTVPGVILGTLMLVGVAINFAGVVSRYGFGHALFWAEETMVYVIIWGVFVGVAAAAYDGVHLNMDLLSRVLEGRVRTAVNAFIALVTVVCCAFVAYHSVAVVEMFAAAGQLTIAARYPKAVPHAALAVGFALTAAAVVVRWRAYLSGKF